MGKAARRAAILGGGQRGAGWAARFVLHGWDVALFDPNPAVPDRVLSVLTTARVTMAGISDVSRPPEGRLRFAERISDAVVDVEWIVECVPERIDLKRKLYQRVQAHCDKDAMIAASSGRYSVRELRACATRAGQILVAHDGTPGLCVPVVNLSGGDEPSPDRLAAATAVLRDLGMAPVISRGEAEGLVGED